MKGKLKTIVATLALSLAFAVTGCQKAEKGEAGTTGTNGKDGNANVSSITLNANTWAWDATNYWSKATWSNISILTSEVASGGAVMLYENLGGGSYMALPEVFNVTSTVQYHSYFAYSTNSLVVFVEASDLSNPNPSTSTQYKLVCIPPAIIKANPNINLKNYSEVKQAMNLQD